jgi:hypothetical protein
MVPACTPVTDRVATCARFYCHLQDQQDPPTEEKAGVALGLSSSLFFSFSPSLVYLRSFPWSIKGKVGRPIWARFLMLRSTSTPLHLHQRLGTLSLSRPFVTPTTNFRAVNTSSLELDIGTFNPNQYSSLCLSSSPFGPNTQYKFTSRRYETPIVGTLGRGLCMFHHFHQALDGWP